MAIIRTVAHTRGVERRSTVVNTVPVQRDVLHEAVPAVAAFARPAVRLHARIGGLRELPRPVFPLSMRCADPAGGRPDVGRGA
ncbi:hypothetical protein SBRY_10878 [Actinacidiphila bryophytorum]|uniref:Uncharacterized protein n=1 Tax=Actinacidiphila bryophytorum TaxID=1436133 RepID=A0A9W4GWG0_9ACTN|nr:hypothetical protein SBRY_10878 [Actinacidiphila bryophytorum]